MKYQALLSVLIFSALLAGHVSAPETQEKYEPTWESLRSRPYPEWFSDAKLGIFIHWGVYSVPAWSSKEQYAEWFLRGLQSGDEPRLDFQRRVYGEEMTYRDYAPLFKAELFDAEEWAALFKQGGARYVLLVSKHHDGYCLWPSEYAKGWNSVDVGPKRDLVGELTEAVRGAGLKMGLYYSMPEWNNELFRWYLDPNDQITGYVEKHMIPQFKELVSAYKPTVLFTDGEWFHSAETWHARELIAWYYNLVGDDAIVNNRWGSGSDIGFLTPEYSAGIDVTDRPWAECRGMGRSFGLNRNEDLEEYLTAEELVHFFVKAVSNGGGMILNVGPKADGQIPLLQQERLVQLGEWLKTNGEAIYGSRPWKRRGEDRRYSMKRVDGTIDFSWVRNTPGKPIAEDDFSVTWTGYLQPPSTDRYRFEAEADDGMRLWVDEKLVLDLWEDKKNTGGIEQVELEADKRYPVKIEYFEKKQNAGITLYWSRIGRNREVVPQSCLYTSPRSEGPGDGLVGDYSSMGRHLCYTYNNDTLYAISLEWPDKILVLNIDEPPLEAKVSLVGRKGNLPWSYRNNRMEIDVSGIGYNEMPSHHAWAFQIEDIR